jgi:hypothetical protein
LGSARFTPYQSQSQIGTTSANGGANLKSKLSTIEVINNYLNHKSMQELVISLKKELEYHKSRMRRIREEKDSLENETIQ